LSYSIFIQPGWETNTSHQPDAGKLKLWPPRLSLVLGSKHQTGKNDKSLGKMLVSCPAHNSSFKSRNDNTEIKKHSEHRHIYSTKSAQIIIIFLQIKANK